MKRARPRPARAKRSRHRSREDRFLAPLHPRDDLLAALWNFAVFVTKQRRRRAGLPKRPLLHDDVSIWCQLRQSALMGCYARHLEYLGDSHPITRRTLSRQINAFKREERITVIRPKPTYRSGKLLLKPNVYTFTRQGILWIKKAARAVQIPEVV